MPDAKVTRALPVILERLHERYPDARYELDWTTPVELLVATILAAQCTDERVNAVTKILFPKYPSARAFAEADLEVLEEDLRPTGFYRQKAKTVQAVCQALVERHGGEVPPTMDALTALPGVARKTANVVLNNAFRLPTGVIVDTHVQRVTQRMGLTDQKKPEKIEADLMKLVPKDHWVSFGPAMVLHGRYTCTHHQPSCADCMMSDLCPRLGVTETPDEEEPQTMAVKKKPVPVTPIKDAVPVGWREALQAEFEKPYVARLEKFVAGERAKHQVYPPAADVFNALKATSLDKVKVVILGQDPYHGPGEAHGLCFSVPNGVKVPPSLVNVFKEIQDDLGHAPPPHGNLQAWADQGVLLLNTVLTVRANEAASHKEQGWETFTDAVIRALNARKTPVVFLLWGAQAQKKKELIDLKKHRVLEAGHPSPLSAKKFFGCKHFSAANQALKDLGLEPVKWSLVPETAAKVAAPISANEGPTRLEAQLPDSWRAVLKEEVRKPYFRTLDKFLAGERKDHAIYPDEDHVFAALRLVSPAEVRVVLVGVEPPASEGVADGLSYSAADGVEPSGMAETIFEELREDLGCRVPVTASLGSWARQGVLLLNQVLTVRGGRPLSHKDKGWETFTDAVIRALAARESPVVFALWGTAAAKKRNLIDASRHGVVIADHPGLSPEGFRGSRVFSAINTALELRGRSGVYWQLQYV